MSKAKAATAAARTTTSARRNSSTRARSTRRRARPRRRTNRKSTRCRRPSASARKKRRKRIRRSTIRRRCPTRGTATISASSSLLAQLAPQAAEPRVAAAAGDVEAILQRVLLVVILVVVLRRVELARRRDRREDRLAEGVVLLPLPLGGLGEALLLRRVVENFRPILRARVAELPVLHRRVVIQPEGLEQLLVAHLRRVVAHLDRLGVTGAPG